MIISNKQKQVDLNKEIEISKAKQSQIAQESIKLQSSLTNLKSDSGSLEESIKETKSTLNDLKSKGCRDNESVRSCTLRIYGVPISSSGMIRPVRIGWISAEFGEPRPEGIHGGTDIAVPVGTPVYAVADGIVSGVWDYGGTGMSIHIIHIVNGARYTSAYQHLSRYEVSVGQTVRRGDEIALSGNTGNSSGPHLHFTLLYGWAGPIKGFHDYGIWSATYWGMWFNPRTMINF
jgi:murein DD-endopeptidase MepM/ murein hydrolase activator NlpD